MYCGYIVRVYKIRKHSNADRLQIATFFGNDTIVGLDVEKNDIGVYFPTDLQLSGEFCAMNDLVRRKDEAGNPCGGYLDPNKRNIKALTLRGEKSDGLYLPISCLDYCYGKGKAIDHFSVGDTIDIVNGHPICNKYIPRSNKTSTDGHIACSRTRKHKVPYAPTFTEHADTEQLAYNLTVFKPGDQIEITLKMHGTSQRTAYLPVLKGYKRSLFDKIFRRAGTPIYDYDYVSGTRRTVLEDFDKTGFYGSNKFRQTHHDVFVGKLHKGETVYYEVVGFTDTQTPIMPTASNSKLGKDFVKQYGDTTVFSYGCHPDPNTIVSHGPAGDIHLNPESPISDIYVYRMTITNPDGEVVEYTPDFMRYRCEQMGIKSVPVFYKGYIPKTPLNSTASPMKYFQAEGGNDIITAGEWVKVKAEEFYNGPDPIGETHVREGVVVRVINRPKFTAYKHKNFEFKVLSGIAVENFETTNGNPADADLVAEM